MAKVRMVTRTVEQTTVSIMCLDVATAEVSTRDFILSGSFDDFNLLLKEARKRYETDILKLVHIENVHVNQLLYGMPESDFIRFATILPLRNINK